VTNETRNATKLFNSPGADVVVVVVVGVAVVVVVVVVVVVGTATVLYTAELRNVKRAEMN
jgi:hypothetical protein